MLDLKQLTLSDKNVFDSYFRKYMPQISELTFTNLFAWRKHYKLKYAIINDYLCIFCADDNNKPYIFPPIGDLESDKLKDAFDVIQQYAKDNNHEVIIKKVYEHNVKQILDILGPNYVAQYDRDNSDYVYLASDLSTLKGNKYHKKRNHVNKFVLTYKYEYVPVNCDNKHLCYDVLDKWLSNKKTNLGSYNDEVDAIKQIVENWDKLDCVGAIINVDDKPQAFTFGERLNKDTAVIHIEKINSEIDGLGEFINKEFCRQNFKDIIYINREQDLGIEGLRKAKKSYLPQKFINKYNIVDKR